MANCADLFLKFDQSISLSPTEKRFLRKARTAITNKIVNKFNIKAQIPSVSFKVQGSFTMNTIIRPIDGEFDIDIGVYFDFQDNDRDNWPTPQTVSGWLHEAVMKHTTTEAENRTSCVRVIYKPINSENEYGYHVDLPIYGTYRNFWDNQFTVIGMNDKRNWNEKSAPSAFTGWFNGKCLKNTSDKKQLIRIVRYLKAWKDFQQGEIKMPNGMILTVLAAKNFEPKETDDEALYKILEEVHFLLWWDFSIIKPVQPENNLVATFSVRRKEYFMSKLKEFRDDAKKALQVESKQVATKLWQKHLGQRFSEL